MGGVPLLIHGDVGLASGEIHHRGDVKIDGSLLPGGQVRAEGDLHITGNVTSATTEVTGNLTVDGIVSGSTTILDAIGRIRVLHALDAKLLAGQDIIVEAAAERCQLHAGGEILLSGPPGLLRGGTARARRGVTAARIEAGGGEPARIEIGGRVFAEDPEELEQRLAFARKHTVQTKISLGDSPEAYRRGLAGLRSYRRLARTLGHRLRQLRAADAPSDVPLLRVTGCEPVSALVHLGPDARQADLPPHGPFEIGLTSDGPMNRPLEEVACEQ